MATLRASTDLQNYIKKLVLDTYFPVGSIYLSVTTTNPGTRFGGTWELVSNDSYLHCYNPNNTWFKNVGINNKGANNETGSFNTDSANGNTGSTAITETQLPSRAMIRQSVSGTKYGCSCNNAITNTWANICLEDGGFTHGKGHTHTLNNHKHFHVLPFYIVAVWKRTK